jgi:hypothetical protein
MEGEASLSIASFGPATLSDSKVRTTNWNTRETNKIDDIEKEMSSVFVSDQPNAKISTTFIHLSKFMGYRITAETISVLEFFTMVEEYGKNN